MCVVDNSISGERVARELDIIAEHRGYPCMIVSNNGTELTSNAILAWQEDRRIEWHYIVPGKPMQNRSWRASTVGCATIVLVSGSSPVIGRPRQHRRMGDRLQSEPPPHQQRRAHTQRIWNPVHIVPQREQG